MTELDSDSFDVFEEGEMIGGDSLSLSCDIAYFQQLALVSWCHPRE